MSVAPPPEIFDRHRRIALMRRAEQRCGAHHFLWEYLAADIADRLACTLRQFDDALIIGPLAGRAQEILAGRATRIEHARFAEEDHLPFRQASFDLIISAATLDSINDLPGALVQIRRALRPDGLFLGAMFGVGSLRALKSAMLVVDGARSSPHIHPQIELRAAADLLSRAGFALPVADQDGLDVRYADWRTMVADLRDAGLGNALQNSRRYPGKDYPKLLDIAWQARADSDGKVTERFEFIHISGWAPAPSQPKPAKRRSGQLSLASILSAENRDKR
jgi:NADH dehydrogenase [ubiquinone] 1 alpha subcomplex assembly factor 5